MGYKESRHTISKKNCECTVCGRFIRKGEEIWIKPGQFIMHLKCHKKDDRT